MNKEIKKMRSTHIRNCYGFINSTADLAKIIELEPTAQLLLRHSLGRLICRADEVGGHRQMILNWPDAFIRDLSWPNQRRAPLVSYWNEPAPAELDVKTARPA